MMQRFCTVILLIAMTGIAACASGQKAEDFAGGEPRLVLEEYFEGRTLAYGIFETRGGDLSRQFKVVIDGTWDGENLVLDEGFFYKDGERDRRIWTFTKTGEHSYTGTAADVVGEAVIEAYGEAVNLKYLVDLKVGDGTVRVRFNDWLYLQEDGVLINRAIVTKFGFKVGEVTLAFIKNTE